MRDIRNLVSQGAAERNFAPGEYKDKNNQSRSMYNLTPKGCLILASGYEARKSDIESVKAIRKMEAAWEKVSGLKFQLTTYTDKGVSETNFGLSSYNASECEGLASQRRFAL